MSILNDLQIQELCQAKTDGDSWLPAMIEPFTPHQVKTAGETKILSYGLSSFGYDVRLDEDFTIFHNANSLIIDPKRFDKRCMVKPELLVDDDGSRYIIVPPNSYVLGHTVEYFRIPRDIVVVAVGKSTLARTGAIVNVTPIEPGFEGNVVIEISNATPLPMKIYANEGVAQFLFFEGEPCNVSYADRGGKYQGQTGLTHAKV